MGLALLTATCGIKVWSWAARSTTSTGDKSPGFTPGEQEWG